MAYNLREIRELHNLTQGELASMLDLTREMVNKMEKDKIRQSKATQLKVKMFLEAKKSEEFSQDIELLGQAASRPGRVLLPYMEQRREQKSEKAPMMVPLVGIKAQAGYVK